MSDDGPRYYPLSEAKQDLFYGRASVHSIRRWIAKGIGNPVIKLKARRFGKYYYVTKEDVEEFQKATEDPIHFMAKNKTRRAERAKRRLAKAGA